MIRRPPVEHQAPDHQSSQEAHAEHGVHGGHAGHAEVFRRRFWVSLILAVPVVLYSQMVMDLFSRVPPSFPGADLIPPALGSVIFWWGGRPFLSGGLDEVRQRRPGMMLLVAMAISVAYGASLATEVGWIDVDLWFELATLIVIMLLGHWQEMKALGQARGALDALSELLPDDAERVTSTTSPTRSSPSVTVSTPVLVTRSASSGSSSASASSAPRAWPNAFISCQ